MKNLLLLFGEYRTFDYVAPQFRDLDKVDVLFSTWNVSGFNPKIKITESHIKKHIPNANVLLHTIDDSFDGKSNAYKMFWHWRYSINTLDEKLYDKVILHRCDMVSNWEELLKIKFEENTLYIETKRFQNEEEDILSGKLWVNDYMIAGGFSTVKKFVNYLDKENYGIPHYPIGDVILQNNISYDILIKKGIKMLRLDYSDCKFIEKMNESNLKLIDLIDDGLFSEIKKKWKIVFGI